MKLDKSILVVTGLSGAGKHQVLYQLEDLGYFCVDNLPASLISQNICLLKEKKTDYPYLAIGVDVRTRSFHIELNKALEKLKKEKIKYRIIFLEAEEEELVRRFSETKRPHPLKDRKTLSDRIKVEMKQLAWLREKADFIVDTTYLTPPELRRQLSEWVCKGQTGFQLTVSSFGFKYGLPKDADMVFDVRFLPNPFYVPALKKLTGKHPKVKRFILKEPIAKDMIGRIDHMIRAVTDGFIKEGKQHLHICIGCTGGQHRSVVIAEVLKRALPGKVIIHHRELPKHGEV